MRHRLIPSWHSMNYLGWWDLHASLFSLYHAWPGCSEAYQAPNEYCFGSERVVCPITAVRQPHHSGLGAGMGFGRGVDGSVHRPGRTGQPLDRLLLGRESIPVLARSDAVAPMDGREHPGSSAANLLACVNVDALPDAFFHCNITDTQLKKTARRACSWTSVTWWRNTPPTCAGR